MNKTLKIFLLLALAAMSTLGMAAATRGRGAAQKLRSTATAPVRTGPVRSLVLARPFRLEKPYEHGWRLEKPSVSAGWLLVLEVDPSFVAPRQVLMPVLLVGDQTAECVNFGQESGRVIAIVPAPADEQGMPSLDLEKNPVWFGSPDLPERVDASWIAIERSRARAADVVTFTAGEIASARERGGPPLRLADRVALEHDAALLILEHSPREHEIAEQMLVPVTK
ncbi:MAG: hypothetical protein ACKVXR_04205 [Planctomycetota bacterium]